MLKKTYIEKLKNSIESDFKRIKKVNFDISKIEPLNRDMIKKTILLLDKGVLRVSEKINGSWITHSWIKKAILLFFRTSKNKLIEEDYTNFFDKFPNKFKTWDLKRFQKSRIRITPPTNVRLGSYVAKHVVLMPTFINIGAYIDEGSMIDSWSTVGSCAQIGKNVHLSGGAGIGGILEPIQSNPTIIENNCFIGARSEIVEGTLVGEGSVISMGVFIGKSTKIFDRETKKIYYGFVPPNSVVIPGNLPAKSGEYGLYCAIVVKKVDEKTRSKIKINDLLRR